MIWLALLKRFWPLLPLALALGFLVFMMHRIDVLSDQRNAWEASAKQYQQNAAEWKASFVESEKRRKSEQGSALEAQNASDKACDQRVALARSSAIKIEGIVTRAPVCKPGEVIARRLVDPDELRSALGGVQ